MTAIVQNAHNAPSMYLPMAHGPPTVAHPRSSACRAQRPRPWATQTTGASAHRRSRRRPPPAAVAAAKVSWRSLAVVRTDGRGVGDRRRRRQTRAQTGRLTKTKQKTTSVSLPVHGCTQPPSTHRFATRRRWPHRFSCLPRRFLRDGTPAGRGGRCRRCATAAAAWAHPLKEIRFLDAPLGGASPQPSGVLIKGARASRGLGVRPAAHPRAHPRAGAHPARPRAPVAPLLSKAGVAPKQTQCMQPQ